MNDTDLVYKRTDKSETEIHLAIEVQKEVFQKEYDRQLDHIAKDARMKGFRPGKVPRDTVETAHGQEARTKALEVLIGQYASEVMRKENILPVTTPTVDVGPPSDSGAVTFTISVPVIPEITVPDFKNITAVPMPVEVTDADIDGVIKQLWQDHRGSFKDKSDRWVKSITKKIGFSSETLSDLREEVQEAVRHEKSRISAEEFSKTVIREAVALSKIQIPKPLMDAEISERERTFKNALQEIHMTEEEFSKSRNVSMKEFRQQWEKDAKEAIETDVLLSAYAKEHGLQVDQQEVDTEVEQMRKGAKDPSDKVFDNPEWRGYIERVLLKRKAYRAFMEEVARDAQKNVGSVGRSDGTVRKNEKSERSTEA